MRPRAVATGRVGVSKEASLELNLSKDRVNCNDWGYYKCKITYTVGNLSSTATSASVLMDLVGRYMNITGNVFVTFDIETEIS